MVAEFVDQGIPDLGHNLVYRIERTQYRPTVDLDLVR
jgi:hypothetical protein